MKLEEANILALINVLVLFSSTNSVPTRLRRNVDHCGRSQISAGRVVGGKNLERGDFPWIVALKQQLDVRNFTYFCGGTLISPNFVISAAHCFQPKRIFPVLQAKYVRAIFGAYDLEDHHEPGKFSLSPTRIILHEEWNPFNAQYDADLSLLQFEAGHIHYGVYIQPICIWNSENILDMTKGIVVGWGSADTTIRSENTPSLLEVPVLTNGICLPGQDLLAKHSSLRTFCAGANGSGVCFGDSGSGLFTKVSNIYYLIGIVSSSPLKNNDLNCDVNKNTVYTNVQKFEDWIKVTAELTNKPEIEVENRDSGDVFTEDEIESEHLRCQPNMSFKIDCNTCWCRSDGKGFKNCTRKACPPKTNKSLTLK